MQIRSGSHHDSSSRVCSGVCAAELKRAAIADTLDSLTLTQEYTITNKYPPERNHVGDGDALDNGGAAQAAPYRFYTPQRCTLIPSAANIEAFTAITLSASSALGA